jgi:ABC transporter substrate binding protein
MLSCLIALAGPLVESFLEVGRGGTAIARSRRPLAAFELRRVTAARFHSYTTRRSADPASGDANASMKPSYSAQDHARGSERYHTIVFAVVSDPVGVGFVAGLPRPGGNLTGFIHMEASMGGKWLELLTEIAPGVKRATIMFNPDTAPYARSYYLPSFEAASRLFKVAPIVAAVHSEAEIETVITSLGREPRGGLVVLPDTFSQVHRTAIILLAARNNVPAAYCDNLGSRTRP